MRVVIVGAGLLGLATAYYLKQHGADVTVIERGNAVALETSFANAGLITPSMASPWNSPGVFTQLVKSFFDSSSPILLRPKTIPSLIHWGINFLRESSKENYLANSISVGQLANYNLLAMDEIDQHLRLTYACKTGTIMVFRNHESFELIKKDIGRLQDFGISYKAMNNAEVADNEPALKPIEHELVGGMYFANDRFGDAYEFCRELHVALEKMGVKFHFHNEATKFNVMNNKISGISTQQGDYTADQFVIAAGSYSTPLLQQAGIKLPVVPVKGYSLSVPFLQHQPTPKYSVIDFQLHAALTPLANILRVGGTAEFTGFNTSMPRKRVLNLINLLHRVYPGYKNTITKPEDANAWAGFRPMTPRGVPVISRCDKFDNLFINSGHGHMGWSLAAGSGKLLADIMHEKPTEIDATPYDLQNS